MVKRKKLGVLLAGMLILISGCSAKKDPEPTPEPEAVEKVTEAKLTTTFSEIQSLMTWSDMAGMGTYRLAYGDRQEDHRLDQFVITGTQFMMSDSAGNGYYADEGQALLRNENGPWVEADLLYHNLWNTILTTQGTLSDSMETVSGVECYKISYSQIDDPLLIPTILMMNQFECRGFSKANIDFYVAASTCKIVRMDVYESYEQNVNGTMMQGAALVCLATASYPENAVINAPEITVETEMETETEMVIPEVEYETETETEEPDDYENGEIRDNVYKNTVFGIQVAGQDLFLFDEGTTYDLRVKYEDAHMAFSEEAYAVGSGQGIEKVNIVTLKEKGITKEDALKRYFAGNESIYNMQSGGIVTLGGQTYVTMTAHDDTNYIKLYSNVVDNRALLMAVYGETKTSVETFETQVYDLEADTKWVAETFELSELYRQTTPRGYRIDYDNSAYELYACMTNSDKDINIFPLSETYMENVYTSDTESTDKEEREVISDHDIPSQKYGSIRYVCVKVKRADKEFYTHCAYLTTGEDVIKYYAVTVEEEDLSSTFETFADNFEVVDDDIIYYE